MPLSASLRRVPWLVAGALFALSGLAGAPAATLTVVNLDGPNEGFNDPAPFTPVGGNDATTLGQARLNAFRYSADLIGKLVGGKQIIRIEATMDALGGSQNSAVLGSAGPYSAFRDFSGAPVAATWFVEALANHLSGVDLDPAHPEIVAQFNSDVDKDTVLGTTRWYYGLDGNAGTDVDFASVVLHELVHGLGFLSLVDLATGAKPLGYDDSFMRQLERHGAVPSSYPAMTNAQRVAASVAAPDLHWIGEQTVTAAGAHVEMYAPNPAETGSSVSHFSSDLFPAQLMEPYYTGPKHSLGLAAKALADMGWIVVTPPRGESGLPPPGEVQVDVTGNVVRLRWSAVPGASGYRAYYGALPGSYVGSFEIGIGGDVSVTVPAGTYYGALTSYDAAGESNFSPEQTVVVAPPPANPPPTPAPAAP